MDTAETRNAFIRALNIEELSDDMKDFLRHPSHYTIAEISTLVERALTSIEMLHDAIQN